MSDWAEENRRAREAAGLPGDLPENHRGPYLEDAVVAIGKRVDHLSRLLLGLREDVNVLIEQGPGVGSQQGAQLVTIVAQVGEKPQITTGGDMAAVDITDSQEVQFDVAEEDAAGYPGANPATPQWSATGVTITNMSDDGLHAVASGPPGAGSVTITIPGAGPPDASGAATDLTGSVDITVEAGQVSQLQVTPTVQAKGSSSLPPATPTS